MKKRLNMILFGSTGPESWLGDTGQLYDWRDPTLLQDVGRLIERAKFDMILLADSLAMSTTLGGSLDYPAHCGHGILIDPMLSLVHIAAATKHIGLASTMSTTFTPPYLLARQMAALDHLSGGRAAWNIVTSIQEEAAQNMGLDELPEHDLRYDMADEYIALCRALWQSWEPDAVKMDRENKIFADPSKIHHIDFEGKYYRSRGPLNTPPTPQRQPVFVVAGVSPRGQRFGAEHAEVTIVSKNSVEDIKRYSAAMRQQLVEAGRDPYSCKLIVMVRPWIGDSEQQAREKMEFHRSKARFEDGLGFLSTTIGIDFSQFDLDSPLPADLKVKGMMGKMLQYATGGNTSTKLTLREIAIQEARRESLSIWGTPEQVADALEEIADEGDIDGFTVRGVAQDIAYLTDFTTKLVPVLQKRGRLRTEYTGSTLRENLFG